ncbi:3-hydroxyisobutyrate dehydrogenase, mitochondrial [Cyphellophora attinorum]|uniref:3-hydroxyisobutyrate dehydrogenase, mitochondrial n=1 Tax=Cyphellophora attinorum TaxID=1664694 RepID=A0A0N1HCH5_9EURO|nr:3-hydroxyisobutyrate dehydrogenase, mitochondrial [Phialophora attinorum]KPI41517.1 3-hydroxyisobutyrate dehydrogenase, mitochondrial [Phialophora attinorum]
MFCTPAKIFACGPPGAGLATKLINNYVAMTSFIGLCEGMNTGIRYGLDPKILGQIINVSSGMSWNSLHMNPVAGVVEGASSNRAFEGGFPTELAQGVMRQARDLMRQVGGNSVFGDRVEGVFERGVEDERCAGKECRSVWRLWEGEGEALEGLTG